MSSSATVNIIGDLPARLSLPSCHVPDRALAKNMLDCEHEALGGGVYSIAANKPRPYLLLRMSVKSRIREAENDTGDFILFDFGPLRLHLGA